MNVDTADEEADHARRVDGVKANGHTGAKAMATPSSRCRVDGVDLLGGDRTERMLGRCRTVVTTAGEGDIDSEPIDPSGPSGRPGRPRPPPCRTRSNADLLPRRHRIGSENTKRVTLFSAQALAAAHGMSPTQVADLLNRFVTQRIQREAIKNGDDLFKVMANEPPHVKANFLKYAVAMKYADTDMAKDVLRKYGHRFAMQFNFN